jgi:type I restriction enzyme R subunit
MRLSWGMAQPHAAAASADRMSSLRKTLYIKFKIRDNDVFERALGYIRE